MNIGEPDSFALRCDSNILIWLNSTLPQSQLQGGLKGEGDGLTPRGRERGEFSSPMDSSPKYFEKMIPCETTFFKHQHQLHLPTVR